MQIQSDVNNRMSESQYQSSAFYDLFQAEQNLVDSITKVINKLFSPLTWILQETLYRRITRQQKGWIDINFLHKNPQIKWLFNKNKIPKGSHRKRNILRKAIDKSVLKRKRNLIKRKDCLLINKNIKNVIYFQIKSLTSKSSKIDNKQITNPHKQIMKQENLKEFIKNCLNEIKHKMEIQAILTEDIQIQIDGQNQPKAAFTQQKIKVLIESMEIKGQIEQEQSKAKLQDAIDEVKNTFKKPLKQISEADKKYFRWCFVYLPSLNDEQMNLLIKKLEENLQKIPNLPPNTFMGVQKMQLQDQMQKLNLEVKQQSNNIQIQNTITSKISLITLTDMIDVHYGKYIQIRQQVGYHPVDNKQLRMIQKQKQKQKQKIQLFECRFMDKRIDLVNDYHKKLQIQRQKQNYFMQKQLKKEQKRRLKQQKRRNKINLSFNQSKEKPDQSFQKSNQQKLRKMIKQNLDEQDKQNHQNQVLDYLIPQQKCIQIQQENNHSKKQQALSLKELEGIEGYSPPKFHIRIPKINQNQLKLKQQQIVQTQILQQKQKNTIKQPLFYNDQEQQQLDSPISEENNDQQFKLPKKRNRSKKNSNIQPNKQKRTQKNNKKSSTPKKNGKANNNQGNNIKDKKEQLKNQNKRKDLLQENDKGTKNQLLDGSFITKEQKRQTQTQRLNHQNNNAYNLRTKKYSEGSYRKMLEFSVQSSQKQFNENQQIFQQQQQKTKGAYEYHTRSSRSKNSKYL